MATNDPMAAALSGYGGARKPVDRDVIQEIVNASADYTSGATMHPRFSVPANDPAVFPTARPQNTVIGENGGARFGIQVPIRIPALPEAGPTTANGRLIQGRGRYGSFADEAMG